jgi:UDP-glucose 4-epimerase
LTARSTLFLVTGGAGFIGSHLVERLLADGHRVRVLDNFSTGSRDNLAFARGNRRLEVVRGDLASRRLVERALEGVATVFHQGAMRSVPRSVADPLGAHASNVTGSLHLFHAAGRQRKKPRIVYASSSSVYGEAPNLPKREDQPPVPISPYAATKVAGELYASVWSRLFGVETVGLRYFNVFGPRQDPKSEYAAVIPRFILWGLRGQPLRVHGDGTQSRDFTYIDNVVSANLLAAGADVASVSGKVYNVGCGSRTSLLEIIQLLERLLGRKLRRRHTAPRTGDVPHTLADISTAKRDFGYQPLVEFEEGFRRTIDFFTGRKP